MICDRETAQGVVILKTDWMLYTVPVSNFLPGSSVLCNLTWLPSKIDARILSRAEWRAASGPLLKRAAAHLVESPALTRVAVISCGVPGIIEP